MKTIMALTVATVIITSAAIAQTATLSGEVRDIQSGEELVGANVLIVGIGVGVSTGMDGKFTIRNVTPGTYSVRFSYIGYATHVVSAVELRPGANRTLDIRLKSEEFQQEEVVVTAERILSTEASVLADRKKSATIGDAISAEQIRMAPDATSGDALKRVTGLTLVDDRFVFVRGVTDRYNGTALNGVAVSSTNTEVDRKSFSFDLIPSSLLENTVVVKTATPDLPGDFSGGLVQVNTLGFPSSFLAKVSFSGGYSFTTTGESFLRSQGGDRDFLGLDDGIRSLPGGNLTPQQLVRTLPNTWAPRRSTAPIATRFNLALGDRLVVGESGEFGYIGAIAYSRNFERNEFSIAPTYIEGASPAYRFAGTRDTYSVLWSGLLDVSYKLGGLHTFSGKYSYNQAAQGFRFRRRELCRERRQAYRRAVGSAFALPRAGIRHASAAHAERHEGRVERVLQLVKCHRARPETGGIHAKCGPLRARGELPNLVRPQREDPGGPGRFLIPPWRNHGEDRYAIRAPPAQFRDRSLFNPRQQKSGVFLACASAARQHIPGAELRSREVLVHILDHIHWRV
jgi:hypothetical protein